MEPYTAKEKMRRIREFCREVALRAQGRITYEDREVLSDLWREYVEELPPEVAEGEALAIIGYPQVVRLKDIPRKILEDPLFAELIVRMYRW